MPLLRTTFELFGAQFCSGILQLPGKPLIKTGNAPHPRLSVMPSSVEIGLGTGINTTEQVKCPLHTHHPQKQS